MERGSVATPICGENPLLWLGLMLKGAKPGVGADRAMPFYSITPQQCRISWWSSPWYFGVSVSPCTCSHGILCCCMNSEHILWMSLTQRFAWLYTYPPLICFLQIFLPFFFSQGNLKSLFCISAVGKMSFPFIEDLKWIKRLNIVLLKPPHFNMGFLFKWNGKSFAQVKTDLGYMPAKKYIDMKLQQYKHTHLLHFD